MWSLNVCTYNIMTPVLEPLRYNGQMERLQRIGSALHQLHQRTVGGLDVIILQELIPGQYRRYLLSRLAEMGWSHVSDSLRGNLLSTKFVSGGVVVCSRRPILAHHQLVFSTECASTDCLANKGIVYCRVQGPHNNVVNVFATHLQAWSTRDGTRIRRAQTEQCAAFMASLDLHPSEAVLFAGDLNVDYYTQPVEVERMSRQLGVAFLPLSASSHLFSSDPNTNSMVGNDDAAMYSTRLYPHGCYGTYLETLTCPCCPQELLDYIGYSELHLRPATWQCAVVSLKVEPFVMKLNMTTERQMTDLSDHYPVIANLAWSSPSIDRGLPPGLVPGSRSGHGSVSLAVLLMFLLLVVVIVVRGETQP